MTPDERRHEWPASYANRGAFVLLLFLFIGVQFFGIAQTKKEQAMTTVRVSDDEASIRALQDKFAAAVNAGDVDAIMKNYIPDKSLVVSTSCRERKAVLTPIARAGKTSSHDSKAYLN